MKQLSDPGVVGMSLHDISPDWKGSTPRERQILRRITQQEGTPYAIHTFARRCHELSDYWYWFTLSTLWVSYSGFSDLSLWRRLFLAERPGRDTSLMKPSELATFRALPDVVTAYRAHRPGETDWISYTMSADVAASWHRRRGGEVKRYRIPRPAVLAFFSRRAEAEVLVHDPALAEAA